MLKAYQQIQTLIAVAICINLSVLIKAQGTEFYPFLMIPVSARVVGMGETSIAHVQGVESLYHNPAGLSGTSGWEIASYNLFSSDFYRMNHVAGVAPVGKRSALGLGVMSLIQPALDKSDKYGNSKGNFEASDMQLNLGLAHRVGNLRFGITGKIIRSEIDSSRSDGFALDIGIQRQFSRGMSLGAGILNLGPQAKFERESANLPTQIKLGLSYPIWNLLLSGEMSRSLHQETNQFSMGAEYKISTARDSYMILRSGYMPNAENLSGNDIFMKGLRTGFGLKMRTLSLDYAVSPFADLGLNHRFSIAFIFGKKRK